MNIKKCFIYLIIIFFQFNSIWAQAPQKMSYQSVIRDTGGNLVVDALVGIKISILKDAVNGTVVFSETHNLTTSSNGLATLEIGMGNPVIGSFSNINWGSGTYFVKTETDPSGGTSYSISGTSQLLSVPYALYADNIKFQGRNSIYIQGNTTDAEVQAILQEQFGPNTENIYVRDTKGLTNLDLSMVTNLTNLEITDNEDLTSLTIDNLSKCYNSILISKNYLLTQINLPLLQYSNSVILAESAVQSIHLPQFTTGNFSLTIGALQTFQLPQFTAGNVSITNCGTLQTFQLPQFATGNFNLKNNNVNSFDMPLYSTGDVNIDNNPSLLQVYLPLFNSPNIDITTCNALEIINLPSVTTLQKLKLNYYVEYLTAYGIAINFSTNLPNLNHVLLPSLTTAIEYIEISGLNVETISMPLLVSASNLTIAKTKITSLNIDSFLSTNLIKVKYNNFLQSVNFGSLVSASAIDCSFNPLLTSINLSSLSSLAGNATNFSYFAYNALPSSQVNAILHQLLTVSPTVSKTVGLDHQTPSAPPTGVGITDKATLISQGNTIATD
jgi:hypothetical protein